jgi:hypothetical protein
MKNMFTKITYNQARRLAGVTVDNTWQHPDYEEPITFDIYYRSIGDGHFLKSDILDWRMHVKRQNT